MASWTTEATASNFNAKEGALNTMSNRASNRTTSGAANYEKGFFRKSDSREYSVVGINVDGIQSMKNAISEYVKAIEDHLNGIEPLADASNAYRSEEIQKAVQEYIEKEKQYCINLTSQLLGFSDKLSDVKNSWEASTSAMAGNVNSAGASLSDSTKYSESIN